MRIRKRKVFTFVLLLLGIRLWLLLPFDTMPTLSGVLGTILAVVLAVMAPLRRGICTVLLRVRRKLDRHPIVAFVGVTALVCTYLLLQVWHNRRDIVMSLHDEHSYLIQARMLATGRLWMHAYPPDMAPFFDTFHVIVDRVYASMYFPGAALVIVPAIWFGLPYWVAPLVCGSAAVGMFYLVLCDVFDPIRGLVGALVLLSLYVFRYMATMLLSETPFLLAAMILTWAWLKWRREKSIRWALLMGAAAGWATITRPLDALCFIAVLSAAVVFETRFEPRVLFKTLAAATVACAPFAALQIVQNIGITGKWGESPTQYYVAENYPAPFVGFHSAAFDHLPQGLSAAKRAYLMNWKQAYQEHTLTGELAHWYPFRLNQLAGVTLPSTLLIIFIPLALASIASIKRLVLIGTAILFLAAYLIDVFHFDHYLVPIMPAIICALLMGCESLERAWPTQRWKIRTFCMLFIVFITWQSLPGFNPDRGKNITVIAMTALQARRDLSQLSPPAVVLFPFVPEKMSVDSFPVFNDDTAWPDDAPIIRANDLGDTKNKQLFAYYARVQPDRKIYRYMRSLGNDKTPIVYLGTARDLNESR